MPDCHPICKPKKGFFLSLLSKCMSCNVLELSEFGGHFEILSFQVVYKNVDADKQNDKQNVDINF